MTKAKAKRRPRGPNPKIRCDVCGRELSQFHLARHRGTYDCVRAHYLELERRKHAIPVGHGVVTYRREAFLWWVFNKAGFDVKDGPLTMGTFWWSSGNIAAPAFGTFAPTWAELGSLGGHDTKDPQAQDMVALAEHLHKDESQERVDARAALATEIELSCVTYEDGYRNVNPGKVRRVIRRWASAAMGGAFPDS